MKVAICVPYYRGVTAHFADSLFALGVHTSKAAPDVELEQLFLTGTAPGMQRNQLVVDALERGADHIFWLDTDHCFPPDTLLRLLAHSKPIVGANYRKRLPDTVEPTARTRGISGQVVAVMPNPDGGLQEVEALGTGICLMERKVFERTRRPWFDSELAPSGVEGLTEDIVFCRNARLAGFRAYIDDDLSMEVGHVAETVLTFPR